MIDLDYGIRINIIINSISNVVWFT